MPTDPISPSVTEFWMEKIIAEKQAEAARAALQSLRERVEGLHRLDKDSRAFGIDIFDGEWISRAAVLAEIDRALE
jgi:hypothetical protein